MQFLINPDLVKLPVLTRFRDHPPVSKIAIISKTGPSAVTRDGVSKTVYFRVRDCKTRDFHEFLVKSVSGDATNVSF